MKCATSSAWRLPWLESAWIERRRRPTHGTASCSTWLEHGRHDRCLNRNHFLLGREVGWNIIPPSPRVVICLRERLDIHPIKLFASVRHSRKISIIYWRRGSCRRRHHANIHGRGRRLHHVPWICWWRRASWRSCHCGRNCGQDWHWNKGISWRLRRCGRLTGSRVEHCWSWRRHKRCRGRVCRRGGRGHSSRVEEGGS